MKEIIEALWNSSAHRCAFELCVRHVAECQWQKWKGVSVCEHIENLQCDFEIQSIKTNNANCKNRKALFLSLSSTILRWHENEIYRKLLHWALEGISIYDFITFYNFARIFLPHIKIPTRCHRLRRFNLCFKVDVMKKIIFSFSVHFPHKIKWCRPSDFGSERKFHNSSIYILPLFNKLKMKKLLKASLALSLRQWQ